MCTQRPTQFTFPKQTQAQTLPITALNDTVVTFNRLYVESIQQLCFQYGSANELNQRLYAE